MRDILHDENRCYEYFETHKITTRDELRGKLKEIPLQGITNPFVECIFADYNKQKKSIRVKSPKEVYKVVCVNDIHIPKHDPITVELVTECIKDIKPDELILNGDIIDCYQESTFLKDPGIKEYLQDECNTFYKIFSKIRRQNKDMKISYVLGNHEARIKKEQWNHPAFYGVYGLTIPNLLKFDKLKIDFYEKSRVINNFEFTHGTKVSQHSSFSAKNEFFNHGCNSGMTGHCFAEDVELLTKRGWVKGLDLLEDDVVGTMNKSTKKFEWNKINAFYRWDNYTEIYNISNICCNISVTDEHGLIFENRKGELFETTPKQFYDKPKECCAIHAIKSDYADLNIEDNLLRLLVNISADGCIEGNAIRFHLKKERKINHLIELLNNLNLDYSIGTPTKTGSVKIRISCDSAKPLLIKYFSNGKVLPSILRDVSMRQARIILDEYSITDGWKNTCAKNSYQIVSKKKVELDLLQEIFVRSGYRTSLIERKNSFYTLIVNTRSVSRLSKDSIHKVSYEGIVWCISVDNGTLITRSNGKTLITLNTHRMGNYSQTVNGHTESWYENGCLCDLNPDYIQGIANWQQGFSVIYFYEDNYHVIPVLIKDHKFIFNGELYSA